MTWLPYPNLRFSAHILNASILGTQLNSAVYLLTMISNSSDLRVGGVNKWTATDRMWSNYPGALFLYCRYLYKEAVDRGYKDLPVRPDSEEGLELYMIPAECIQEDPVMPDWMGIEKLHSSHRAALLERDPEWFGQFGWLEKPVSSLFYPYPMPLVGQSMINKTSGEVRIVQSFDSLGRPVLFSKSADLMPVERSEIISGEWRRCLVQNY